MLEFENQMLLDILNGDGLLIAAKGLSIETVILNLMKVYCDPGNLVFVLGSNGEEEDFFIKELQNEGVTPLPKVISAETSTSDREAVYLDGGVLFISSRILVVDMLKKRVPVSHITGIVVLKAHKILNLCQDAFALRLFRQENSTGFVNAFSRSPVSFTLGMLKLDRIMKTLFTNQLHLWPRFHTTVSSSLKEKQPAVFELHIPLSSSMSEIQTATLDLIHFCIKELKRINPSLSAEEVTVENALSKSFQRLLHLQLDPIWNQLSAKTKQLIADLKILRSVLVYLTQSDCVRLHSYLNSLRSKEYFMTNSGWMILDSAETLFITAKNRIFNLKQELEPEMNPKWDTLNEVLNEIQQEKNEDEGNSNVLVLVDTPSTVKQLKQVLTMGGREMLNYTYYKLFGNDTLNKEASNPPEEEEDGGDVDTIALTQRMDATLDENTTFTECSNPSEVKNEPVIVIRQFKKDGDSLSLRKVLKELKPSAVVMYDIDIAAIRQIEVYQSSCTHKQMKVYFLIYGGSVEEQAYLTALRQEKEAFEFLIKEKASLVMEDPRALGSTLRQVGSEEVSSRKGGGETRETPRVIVDMREFRSELPALLYKRGIDIEPLTLQIGDYILTPEMCVERKSISDLIGSLHSGRLYTQALAMTRHYAKPILLIEFDESKPFALQGRYYLSTDVSSNDIRSRLQLLTIHFPKLRIVWSPSPFASAQLFQELKEGKEEPCGATAVAIGLEESQLEQEKSDDKFNTNIMDLVSKLPGINSKNIHALLNKGKSLDYLITLSLAEIESILGHKVNAEIFYNGLHKEVKLPDGSSSSDFRAKYKSKNRGRQN